MLRNSQFQLRVKQILVILVVEARGHSDHEAPPLTGPPDTTPWMISTMVKDIASYKQFKHTSFEGFELHIIMIKFNKSTIDSLFYLVKEMS